MPQLGLVLNHTEHPVYGGLERGEARVNCINLNGIPGRTRLKSLLGAILPPILNVLQRSRVWLGLLSLAILLGMSSHRASRCFF